MGVGHKRGGGTYLHSSGHVPSLILAASPHHLPPLTLIHRVPHLQKGVDQVGAPLPPHPVHRQIVAGHQEGEEGA